MMKTIFLHSSAMPRGLLAAVAVLGLSACSSIGYRCPIDPTDKPDSPTACAGMGDAMAGAKRGMGGRTSVLVDDQGRLVPPELVENRAAVPLAQKLAAGEPYRDASGAPVFHQPKVFQVWTAAFVDDNGNLHDGHHAWFTTPGRWAYGTVNQPGAVGANTLRPADPSELPAGRIIPTLQKGQRAQPVKVLTQQEKDKAAMQNLSNAANAAATSKTATEPRVPPAQSQVPGVTAPSVALTD